MWHGPVETPSGLRSPSNQAAGRWSPVDHRHRLRDLALRVRSQLDNWFCLTCRRGRLGAMVGRLLERYYPMQPTGVRLRNCTLPFYRWIAEDIPAAAAVLNIGAGPTPEPERRMRGRFGKVVGVDPDPIVMTNQDLDEAIVSDGIHLPFPSESFDRAYSDWTLEHVERPLPFLAEVYRVLKPGGSFFARTTNRLHYVTIISALTPHWFHRMVANRARQLAAEAHEPWPTRYRMNRPRRLRSLASQSGFACEIRLIEPEPVYMKFTPIAFLGGVAYERLVNHFAALKGVRLIILVRFSKPLQPAVGLGQ